MKTAAIIASLTVVGSLAFAAGKEGVKPVDPEVPQAEGTLASANGSESMQALAADQCAIGEPLNWFTKAYRLPPCFAQRWSQSSLLERGQVVADIDRDGKDDHLIPMHFRDNGNGCVPTHTDQWEWGSEVGNCGFGWDYPFLWKPATSRVGGTVTLTLQPVLSNTSVNTALVVGDLEDGTFDYSYYTVSSLRLMDLFDLDGDGDLDVIVYMVAYAHPNEGGQPPEDWTGLFWLENNAIPNPPLAADLNHDGNVDGVDLGLLLAAWGS
jgi:hypothetical protein